MAGWYPTRTPALAQRLWPHQWWRLPQAEPMPTVYLTFDDGPTPGITPEVLRLLAEHGAAATFFMVGNNAQQHPALVHRVLAEGHAVGNHTHRHADGWRVPFAEYLRQIQDTDELLHQLTGQRPALFRPPYGHLPRGRNYVKTLAQHHQIVMWDVLTADFDPRRSVERCLQATLRHLRPGSIVVLHDSARWGARCLALLPGLLHGITQRGWAMRALPNPAH